MIKKVILTLACGLILSMSQIQISMSHCNTEGTNGWCNYYEEEIGGVEKKCESTRKEGAYTGKCLLNSGGGTVPVIIH